MINIEEVCKIIDEYTWEKGRMDNNVLLKLLPVFIICNDSIKGGAEGERAARAISEKLVEKGIFYYNPAIRNIFIKADNNGVRLLDRKGSSYADIHELMSHVVVDEHSENVLIYINFSEEIAEEINKENSMGNIFLKKIMSDMQWYSDKNCYVIEAPTKQAEKIKEEMDNEFFAMLIEDKKPEVKYIGKRFMELYFDFMGVRKKESAINDALVIFENSYEELKKSEGLDNLGEIFDKISIDVAIKKALYKLNTAVRENSEKTDQDDKKAAVDNMIPEMKQGAVLFWKEVSDTYNKIKEKEKPGSFGF